MLKKICGLVCVLALATPGNAQTSRQQSVTVLTATMDTPAVSSVGTHLAAVQWKFATVTGSYTGCTAQASTTFDGTNYLTLGAAASITVTTGTTNAWVVSEPTGAAVSSTIANSFGLNMKLTIACSGYGTSAPGTVSLLLSSVAPSGAAGAGSATETTLAALLVAALDPADVGVAAAATTPVIITALNATSQTVVAAATVLDNAYCSNTDTTNWAYVQFFNVASPTVGTTVPSAFIGLPPGGGGGPSSRNWSFDTYLKVAATTTATGATNAVTTINCTFGIRQP